MRGVKIFLIIVFIASILFVVSIIPGLTHSDEQNTQTPGWLSRFGATFSGSQSLKLADLSPAPAGCLQQGNFVVPAQRTCVFTIRQSMFARRVMKMQLVQGASATVTLTQEQTLPVQESLAGAGATTTADFKIYPGKTHGMLKISCLNAGGAAACLLKLK